jgi:hypothetical protein
MFRFRQKDGEIEMYGLEEDFDTMAFVGGELTQVCFSVNTIGFDFDNNISITLLSSFVYRGDSGDPNSAQAVPVASSNLMRLTGHSVESASASRDGTLVLVFDNGHSLTFLDDSQQYESYSIRIGDREIIV